VPPDGALPAQMPSAAVEGAACPNPAELALDGELDAEPPPELVAAGAHYISQLDDYVDARGKRVPLFPFDTESTGKNVQLDSITELAAQAWVLHIKEVQTGRPRRGGKAAGAATTKVAPRYTATWTVVPGVRPFRVAVRPYALATGDIAAAAAPFAGDAAGVQEEKLTPLICKLTSFTQKRAAEGLPFSDAWADTEQGFMPWAEVVVAAVVAMPGGFDFAALLAHRAEGFDMPMLLGYGTIHGIDVYASLTRIGVTAVADSWRWSHDMVAWPDGERPDGDSEGKLYEIFFPDQPFPGQHTAPGDVEALVRCLRTPPFIDTAAQCGGRLFVSLGQHVLRQRALSAAWVPRQGGYGRADVARGLCRCYVVRASRVIVGTVDCPATHLWYCARLPYRDKKTGELVGGPGCKRQGEGAGLQARLRPGGEGDPDPGGGRQRRGRGVHLHGILPYRACGGRHRLPLPRGGGAVRPRPLPPHRRRQAEVRRPPRVWLPQLGGRRTLGRGGEEGEGGRGRGQGQEVGSSPRVVCVCWQGGGGGGLI
jgi:hypothetical protein